MLFATIRLSQYLCSLLSLFRTSTVMIGVTWWIRTYECIPRDVDDDDPQRE